MWPQFRLIFLKELDETGVWVDIEARFLDNSESILITEVILPHEIGNANSRRPAHTGRADNQSPLFPQFPLLDIVQTRFDLTFQVQLVCWMILQRNVEQIDFILLQWCQYRLGLIHFKNLGYIVFL